MLCLSEYWRPTIESQTLLKNVLMWVFICSFCPRENIFLMLPTHSESVLWHGALSKWQNLHDLWHWKWVWFCFWIVCYQRTKILWAACSQHSCLPKLAVQWKAKSRDHLIASCSLLSFLSLLYWYSKKTRYIGVSGKIFFFSLFIWIQTTWQLFSKSYFVISGCIIIFFQYCELLRITFPLFSFIYRNVYVRM